MTGHTQDVLEAIRNLAILGNLDANLASTTVTTGGYFNLVPSASGTRIRIYGMWLDARNTNGTTRRVGFVDSAATATVHFPLQLSVTTGIKNMALNLYPMCWQLGSSGNLQIYTESGFTGHCSASVLYKRF